MILSEVNGIIKFEGLEETVTFRKEKDDQTGNEEIVIVESKNKNCLLYTSPSPRDRQKSRMPSSA